MTLVGLITIAASTYTSSTRVASPCSAPSKETAAGGPRTGKPYDVIVFGLGRYGGAVGRRLALKGHHVLGIDFSPLAVKRWRDDGYDALYGDVSDPEFIATLPLTGARWVVSTVREPSAGVNHADGRVVLVQALRDHGFRGSIAVTWAHGVDADALLAAGASIVLEPFQDAADRVVELLDSNVRPVRLEVIEPQAQKDIGL